MNSIELYAELITINDEEDITDDDVELIIDNCIISNNDQQLNMKVNIKESIKKISKKLKENGVRKCDTPSFLIGFLHSRRGASLAQSKSPLRNDWARGRSRAA